MPLSEEHLLRRHSRFRVNVDDNLLKNSLLYICGSCLLLVIVFLAMLPGPLVNYMRRVSFLRSVVKMDRSLGKVLVYVDALHGDHGQHHLVQWIGGGETAAMQFARNLIKWLLGNRLNGLMLEGVFPAPARDRSVVIKLLKKMYTLFKQAQLLLVIVAPDYVILEHPLAFGKRLSPYLHYLVVRNHDHRFGKAVNSLDALQKRLQDSRDVLSATLNVAMAAGMPSKQACTLFRSSTVSDNGRLLASMTLDGISFSVEGKEARPGKPRPVTNEFGVMAYFEVCVLVRNSSWTRMPSRGFGNPMAYRDMEGVVYEDPESARHKVDVAKSSSLGGLVLWDVTSDDYRGDCGAVNPITTTVVNTLRDWVGPGASSTSSAFVFLRPSSPANDSLRAP
ncbi:chitinase, putative [Ixodes scapularis]|uniref:Chitinase, putative n=1 Tax=Ixodes scapularis TaxID=6945 RepID=B7QC90_IXOSC|nr:chitinase, putative [Ixodes scapularis]|eukprot:XP_002413154.1 chitinase, putative [Ixodes scapularis]